ncbi:COP9 signalosome complex subunit 5 [Microbotryum lychnidis-dioicae p1A1 Lamole]|uniref:COP9 signalosome complex subunit 5 n=1 Tax=Microbotryum lychnidis-dioicae (strain p1A1 Lamole / MvSl-1064) TaxID=683840 RepID=U5H2R1_USTV1|nr:COP9 signalosome complex subunit 5 [Microbotryum lychnidis-dioicae p1A1 Lamole]|eukprot:KDE08164.1 COP9 signalosome complex subunit 5 [Microbotryum lychnidis-dioicae p1A1 Lamole]
MAAASSSSMTVDAASTASKTFELNNDIQTVDSIFRHDQAEQRRQLAAQPWKKDPHYFQHVRISAVALIKMVMHARSGGQYEIMGLMQGKLDGDTMVVMDAFALPVVGTETRVNAQNDANEFMIQYIESSSAIGRLENIIGWYHSHPGYGCWLSGIDVQTQKIHQAFEDPFLAVVIDPNRTISAGRVEIGAFRTYPDNYTPPNAAASEYQSIPLNKVEDFGVHANSYYPLEISHFKSTRDTELLDKLWNKYWVTTLIQSPMVTNRAYTTAQLGDLVEKLSKTDSSVQHRCGIGAMSPIIAAARAKSRDSSSKDKDGTAKKEEETPLARAVRDSNKMSAEASQNLIGMLIKDILFNGGRLAQQGRNDGHLELPPVTL